MCKNKRTNLIISIRPLRQPFYIIIQVFFTIVTNKLIEVNLTILNGRFIYYIIKCCQKFHRNYWINFETTMALLETF